MCADDSKLSEFQTRYAPDGCKAVPFDVSLRNGITFTTEQDDEDKSAYTDSQPYPKFTMSEKWIMDQQRKKLLTEQNWVLKQQKTKQRIATCFYKLKVCLEISPLLLGALSSYCHHQFSLLLLWLVFLLTCYFYHTGKCQLFQRHICKNQKCNRIEKASAIGAPTPSKKVIVSLNFAIRF